MVDPDLHYGAPIKTSPVQGKSKKLIILFVIIVVLVIVSVVAVVFHHHRSPNTAKAPATSQSPTTPTEGNGSKAQQKNPINSTTTTQNTSFTNLLENDDNPNKVGYQVTSGTEPASGWFILHIATTTSYGTFPQIAVVKQDNEGSDVVAGPDTSFPLDYLRSKNVPQVIINLLPTYDEQNNG